MDFYASYFVNGRERKVNKFTTSIFNSGLGPYISFNCTDDKTAEEALLLEVEYTIAAGVYHVPNGTDYNMLRIERDNEYYQPNMDGCILQIDEHDQKNRKLSGHFEGVVYKIGPANPDSLLLENGKFSIAY